MAKITSAKFLNVMNVALNITVMTTNVTRKRMTTKARLEEICIENAINPCTDRSKRAIDDLFTAIDERDERLRLAEEFRVWVDSARWIKWHYPKVNYSMWDRVGYETTLYELFLKCRDED